MGLKENYAGKMLGCPVLRGGEVQDCRLEQKGRTGKCVGGRPAFPSSRIGCEVRYER